MPTTSVRGRQLRDDDVTRADLNVTTAGSAVIRRVIAGSGVSISSTGVDTGTGDVTISLSASAVTGSGTTNYVAKFTGTGTLGNSQIFDNGTNVGIGVVSSVYRLNVNGSTNSSTYIVGDHLVLAPISSNTISGMVNPIWGLLKPAGRKLYYDENFSEGINGISVYNNNGGTALTITRKTSSFLDTGVTPIPNRSGAVLEIMHAPQTSLGTSPGFGGFTFFVPTEAGSRRLLLIFKMKVPSGRTLLWTSNATGNNSSTTWLTNNAGTGQYQDYALVLHTGNDGSYSSTHFIYIVDGSSTTFYTYLASATVYDVTDLSIDTVRSLAVGYNNSPPAQGAIIAGNVGIGTNSPSAPLMFGKAVYGPPSGEDFYRIKFQDVGGIHNDIGIGQPVSGAIGINYSASGYISFSEGTNNERVRIAAGGNVGIGTTSPQRLLHIQSANGTASQIQLGQTSQRDYYIGIPASQTYLDFFDASAGASRMVISSAGNVGIGTTSPSNRLEVAGGDVLLFPSDNTRQLSFFNSNYGIKAASGLEIFTGDVIRFRSSGGSEFSRFASNGNFLIGTSTDTGYKLNVNGTSLLNGSTLVQGEFAIRSHYTVIVPNLGVGTTQHVQYEVMRAFYDFNDWSDTGVVEIEIHERYYSPGLKKKYVLAFGYFDDVSLTLVEMIGGGSENHFRLVLGSKTLVGGDIYYYPLLLQIRNYTYVDVIIRSRRARTTNINGSSNQYFHALYINESPASTNISPFTPDSVVYPNNRAAGHIFNGSITATSIIKSGGTSSQYLMADGSVSTLTNPTTGTGTTNVIPKFTSATTLGNSTISDNGTTVSVGTNLFVNSADDRAFIVDAGGNSRLGIVKKLGSVPVFAASSGNPMMFGHWSTAQIEGNVASGTFTERIRIAANGNIGINDTNPTDLLVVNGRMRVNGTNPIAFGNNQGGYALIGVTDATTGNLAFSTFSGVSMLERMRLTAAGRLLVGTTTEDTNTVDIAGTLRSTQGANFATSSGSVGIGTTSPSEKLHVAGNIFMPAGQIFYVGTSRIFESSGRLTFGTTSNPMTFTGQDGGLRDFSFNGNVGIGTTSPTTTLQVSASSVNSSSLRIGQTTLANNALGTWTGLEFTLSNEVSQLTGNPASRISSYLEAGNNMFGLQFWTRNDASTFTEKVRITAVGNVGINTVSPSYRLDVNGTLRSVNDAYFATTNGSVGIGTTSPNFTSGTGLHIRVAGDAVMRVTAGARTGFDVAQETVGGLVYLFNRDNTDVIIAINDGEKARFKPNGQFYLGAVPTGGYGASFLFQTSGGLYVQQTVRFNNLAGTGTRVVVASSDGTLSTDTLTAASVGATSGNGTTNYVTKYTGTSTLGNSQIFDNATNVGIGTASPEAKLHIANLTSNNTAYQHISYISANNSTETSNESYTNSFPSFGLGFRRQWSSGTFTNIAGIYAFGSGGWRGGLLFRTKDNITSTGEPDINALYLSPIGRMGVNTTDPSQVLDVNGRIRARTIDTNGSPTFYLTADANGVIQRTSGIPSGGGTVNGSGTTGYVPRWTSSTAIGNSVIFDAGGTNIGVAIGHTTPYSPGGHASLHIGGYNSGRGLITFGWGAANAGPTIYSSNDDSLTIASNSYVWAGTQLRTTKLMVNTSTDSGHDAHVQGSLAVTGFIRVYRDPSYGTKNIIVNDDGFVFMQMQSNDQIRIPRPTNFDSTVRFGLFEWYPSYQTGNNWANLRIGASANGGTRHEFVFNFESEIRSQNWNGNLIGFTGHAWMGNVPVRGFYFAPSQITGSTSLLYAWENTHGNIKFGNLAGSGTRMVVCDSDGVLSTQSIPGGGGGNTIYSGDGTLSGQRVITGAGNNIRLSNGGFHVSNSGNTQRLEYLFDGIYSVGVDLTLFAPTNQNLIFSSGNGPAGRFTASKKLLIGTSSETGDNHALLVVGGFSADATIQIGGSTNGYSSVYFGDGSGADRYAGYVQYNHSIDEMVIGTAKNNRVKINSSGRIDATGDIVAFSSSDFRLKQNIKPISTPMEKLSKINGVTFNWKKEYLHIHGYTNDDVGVIAQEIQQILPEAVRKNETGYFSVRYEKLIPLLIEAIKEQQTQIEDLKKRLN